MRLNFLGKPKDINAVAVSGGVDSMVLLDFLLRAGHKPKAVFFHHNTDTSEQALQFLNQNFDLVVGHIDGNKPKNKSIEDWWRIKRYEFLSQFGLVATGHHLNDVAETYLFSAIHGQPKIIPQLRDNGNGRIIRPLLTTPKSNILQWAKDKNVPFIEDQTNKDLKYPRNSIRHEILPLIEKRINKGFLTMVKKKIAFVSQEKHNEYVSHRYVCEAS